LGHVGGFCADLTEPEPKMRLIAFSLVAVFAASGPAAAQSWQEYAYPNLSFVVSFPAEPRIENTIYPAADGSSAEAIV
jgi:hypothetical protein